MEEGGKGGVAASDRVSPSSAVAAADPQANRPSYSNPSAELMALAKRRMFSVELKPGQTTIVSWKKLRNEGRKSIESSESDAIAGSMGDPAADQSLEGELQDAQPSNRFSAVIEKIERLYMGDQSSDEEELDDAPDDDQYDTEDSFIDDAELDEYFQVDKLTTKHDGYFVNRGKLERIESSSSPNLAPKKRRRKDSTEVNTQTNHEHTMRDPVTMGNIQKKASARSAPSMGKELANPSEIQTAYGEHFQEGEVLKNKPKTSRGPYKKRLKDSSTNIESSLSGKISRTNIESTSSGKKDVSLDRHKGVLPSTATALKSRSINESVGAVHHSAQERAVCSQVESQSKKLLNCENEAEISTKKRRKESYGIDGCAKMDSTVGAYPMQVVQPLSARVKDGSAARPKGAILEKAIRDLEKIAASCRPPKLELQKVDASSQAQGVKRRLHLPQDVKEMLAKVARISAGQNKISEDDLIDRLMSIVGHIVQRRTLKRNMREMLGSCLSVKQENSGRFQLVKQEVNEMIRTRLSLLKFKLAERQDGSADDFQVNGKGERRERRKYCMNIALEDKICELYDLYAEEMDEDKGPQSRKLYEELAELWPNGYMDSDGVKDAISRSKERKRSRILRHKSQVLNEERKKRKKLASAARVEETGKIQSGQEKRAMDPTSQSQVLVSSEKATTNSDTGHHHISKNNDKARVSSSSTSMVTNNVKKKVLKRKPGSDQGKIHSHPTKLSPHEKEREQASSNAFLQPKPAIMSSN